MRAGIIFLICFSFLSCANQYQLVEYKPNMYKVVDPLGTIKRTIEQQPKAYAYLPSIVEVDDYSIKLFLNRRSPTTIYYKNIGELKLAQSLRYKVWHIEINDRAGYYLYWVYTYDRAEAERFIDSVQFMISHVSAQQAPPNSYPIIGVFEDHNEVFSGRIIEKDPYGESAIELKGRITGMKCNGRSYVTRRPRKSVNCKGLAGEARVYCDDSRIIKGTWHAIACRKGIAEGTDQNGNHLKFVYGMSEYEAQSYIARLAELSSTLPPVPPVYRPKQTRIEKGYSTGTGFFVTNDGYLLTSYHVIEDASNIAIRIKNGDFIQASLVKSDPSNDLALLKVSYVSKPLVIGASSSTAKADEVFTLGYPLIAIQGQEQKANFGKINSMSGYYGDIRLLQIDVPIQPGNSGGPLVNTKGEVIGIVNATLNQLNTLQRSGFLPQNVGYAVKIDYTFGLLQGTIGNSWKNNRKVKAKANLRDLVRLMEPSVVLVIAR